MPPLPLLPTSTIGSYAPPSWFEAAVEAIERGEFGTTDREETYDDATRAQVQHARDRVRSNGNSGLQTLLNGRDTWTVVG